MAAMAWIDIALVGSMVTSWIAVVLALVCIKRLRRQSQLTQRLCDHLHRQLQVANSGAIGMGQRLLGLERQLKSTVRKQQQFEHQSENQLSYSQAVSLFDTGIAAADVARACGLSQAEASLMEMMHRQMKGGAAVA